MSYLPKYSFPVSPHITCMSVESLGAGTGLVAGNTFTNTTVWPTANTAVFIPFSLRTNITVLSLFILNGTTVSGNIDMGIYSFDGIRIVSAGSTIQSGTSTTQNVSITPLTIGPGQYYLAFAIDNITAKMGEFNFSAAVMPLTEGVYSMASAFPLPATATFATSIRPIPVVGLSTVSTV